MKQFVPQANHAGVHFILLAPDHKALAKGADGKYVEWGVEMAGTAAIAQQDHGDFVPAGTVFSVHLNHAARTSVQDRCHRQVPGRRRHQQTEAPRGRQALRLGSGATRRRDQLQNWMSTSNLLAVSQLQSNSHLDWELI